MELMNAFLNVAAPVFTAFCFSVFLPPFYLLKLFLSTLNGIFHENLRGKVVLIAGASFGIGEHLAYEYGSRGARLALAARRKISLEEVSDVTREIGSPDVITIQADVSKIDDCKRMVDETINHFGRLDHLVNNAGITPVCLFEDIPNLPVFRTAMDINFWGMVYATHFAIPHLRETKGRILVISSAASWLTAPRMSFYNASKSAVSTFFETLRIELAPEIGITIVTPGLTESEVTKGKFFTKDGKLTVDQDLRDVQVGPVPVRSVRKSTKRIVDGVCRGDRTITEPSWYRFNYLWMAFLPEVIEWSLRLLYFPAEGRPETEALNKKILDVPGVRRLLYPESILNPEIKTG